MTTTSSTSSTSGSSILTTLSGGSSIDTAALVSGLVSATYDPKTAAITAKEDANTAKVSALATLTGGIDAFASALGTLISGGSLFTQPTTSDSSILTATAKGGASIGDLSAQVEVRQTAQAESLVSGYQPSASSPIGQGQLMLAVGQQLVTITVGASNDSLAGLARSINSANVGVTASVVTDAYGARLTLKGQTGAANTFYLQADANAAGSLAKLNFGGTPMALSGGMVTSAYMADATTTPVGQGDLTLTTANGTATISIDAAHDNLDGLAQAINDANLGLTASVTTDANGSYLVVADSLGGTPSFTLEAAAAAQAGLSRFAYGVAATGLTQAQAARDAIVRMDGVDIARSSNTIDDVIEGVTLKLVSEAPGTVITLGADRPTSAISQAVADFVSAYNELRNEITSASASSGSPLYGNSAVREMNRQLSRLTGTALRSSTDGPATLAEIGVSTNRDGTLSLDTALLTKMLAAYPDQVEAMFNPVQKSDNPLIRITSAMGAVKPGVYQISNVTAQNGTVSAQGIIGGVAAVSTGSRLYASVSSAASGLVIEPLGDVASATITVDLGLGGALQAIRDSLRNAGGALDALSTSLTAEKTKLTTERSSIAEKQSAYEERLTNQFSKMNSRVAAYKSIQDYLEQQVAVWTKSD